jgi:hypothetical protein
MMAEPIQPDERNVKWIAGDGGPLVVLQQSAALQWEGAARFGLTQRESVETDYDAICRCNDGVSVIRRHGRDSLVLSDSEWQACFVPTNIGEVAVIQWFGSDSSFEQLVRRLRATRPSATLPFTVMDTTLRLLVGADDGNGAAYGFSELSVEPGEKVCEVYYSKEAQLAVLRPRAQSET